MDRSAFIAAVREVVRSSGISITEFGAAAGDLKPEYCAVHPGTPMVLQPAALAGEPAYKCQKCGGTASATWEPA